MPIVSYYIAQLQQFEYKLKLLILMIYITNNKSFKTYLKLIHLYYYQIKKSK